ncbi:MAG: M15 family metallopeptidase [Oscillospiraceae bacterium]|nr:M15 family metallopeptidase [Oscillospiraceae bacterium]
METRKSKRRIRKSVFILPAIALGVLIAWLAKPAPEPPSVPEPPTPSTAEQEVYAAQVSQITQPPDDIPELINAWNAVSDDDYELASVYGIVPAATATMQLNPEALESLRKMFWAAKASGYDSLYLSDGYRSYDEQAELYENAADKSYVQPPGHSEHQTGLAADIACLNEDMSKFTQTPQGAWVNDNAHKYGFILRYPADKTEVTGISYEPWHFRYVGVTHATYMYKNNLVLEEYVEYLKNS